MSPLTPAQSPRTFWESLVTLPASRQTLGKVPGLGEPVSLLSLRVRRLWKRSRDSVSESAYSGSESADFGKSPGTRRASQLTLAWSQQTLEKIPGLCQRVSLLWRRVRGLWEKSRDFASESADSGSESADFWESLGTLSASPLPTGKVCGLGQQVSGLSRRVPILSLSIAPPLRWSLRPAPPPPGRSPWRNPRWWRRRAASARSLPSSSVARWPRVPPAGS